MDCKRTFFVVVVVFDDVEMRMSFFLGKFFGPIESNGNVGFFGIQKKNQF